MVNLQYIFSKQTARYWVTISLALLSLVGVFIPPNNAYLILARLALTFSFTFIIPGFSVIKAILYPKIEKSSRSITTIVEIIALSFIVNLLIIVIVAIVLNFSPWGIRLIPMTLSLLFITFIFSTIAVIKEANLNHH